MNAVSGKCPICETSCTLEQVSYDYLNLVKCPRCSNYTVSDLTKDRIEKALTLDEIAVRQYAQMASVPNVDGQHDIFIEVAKKSIRGGIVAVRSLFSYAIRKRDNIDTIKTSDFINILKNHTLPKPAEQANNLILFLGDYLLSPGDFYKLSEYEIIYGLLGLRIDKEYCDLEFLINSLEEQKILSVVREVDYSRRIALTLFGWQKFEELRRSITDSRKAFVAMAFVNPEKPEEDYFFQNELLDRHLIPAVRERAEYELSNPLASSPMAGNIHARIEVEIRTAKFIVAELSHHNNGAYWEAGFARALGKPVIYMYNKVIGKSEKPHFDVGSDHIIFWEKDKPDEAAQSLVDVIRATLFSEAKLSDD